MARFDAVVFDLDGTLCRHEQDTDEIYFGAFERAGLDSFGAPSDLWTALDGPPDPQDRLGYLREGFRAVAHQYDRRDADSEALARGFLSRLDFRAVSFLDGAKAGLAAARDHASVGLMTNGPEHRQTRKINALGLEDAFDAVVFAGDMDRRKPHPDPFDRVVSELSVSASDTLYVGNSLEYDVAGAQAAGLPVAWCPEDGDTDPGSYDPDYVLESLSELASILVVS
ncbi:HAD family hydrolase [Halogeometricum borinquense]|uniref:HAD family hydrolase n=1 Tax=Halogeometricum borinquense TaxID=60847 RepID=UPI00341AD42A